MSQKTKKKNRKRAKNQKQRHNCQKTISSIEADKHLVSIQFCLSKFEEMLLKAIENPEDSSCYKMTSLAYLSRSIELADKLRNNGYPNLIDSLIEVKRDSIRELIEMIPDDDEEMIKADNTETVIKADSSRYKYFKPDYSAWDAEPLPTSVRA